MNLTRTIGVTIYCYEINFIVTSKSRALMKQLIVIDQLWHLVRTQALVKHDCETCPACMKKNPITQPAKGSRKPIRSRCYRDRFQIDPIDFCKLRKRDPFGVLMRWGMTIKDHSQTQPDSLICVLCPGSILTSFRTSCRKSLVSLAIQRYSIQTMGKSSLQKL